MSNFQIIFLGEKFVSNDTADLEHYLAIHANSNSTLNNNSKKTLLGSYSLNSRIKNQLFYFARLQNKYNDIHSLKEQ